MLYRLLYPLHESFGAFNVFRYITFRTALAIVTAMLVSFLLGPWLVRRLRDFQIGQERAVYVCRDPEKPMKKFYEKNRVRRRLIQSR